MGSYGLGEAFVVTDLVEEFVTVDDDDSPILKMPGPHQKPLLKRNGVLERTNQVQTKDFPILLIQKHKRVRRCLLVD